MDRVTTFSAYSGVINNLMTQELRLQTAETQVSSGKVATDLKGFGVNAEALTAAQSLLTQVTGFVQTATTLTSKLDAQDVALGQVATAGSIQASPVNAIRAPAATTPAEIIASAAMWVKAERTLMSCPRPRKNSTAVRPLTTTPAAAVAIISIGTGEVGAPSRLMASRAMKPQANTSSTALTRAASTVALPKP